MTPDEVAAVLAVIELLAKLTEEGIQAADAWIHSDSEQRQVYAARVTANAAVDAYEDAKDGVK
jgi:hypothetical protein